MMDAFPHNYNSNLPAGWEEKVSQDGRAYYTDHKTQRTQWFHPITRKRKRVVAGLPPGWITVECGGGEVKYINKTKNISTHIDPRLPLILEEKDYSDDMPQNEIPYAPYLSMGSNISNQNLISYNQPMSQFPEMAVLNRLPPNSVPNQIPLNSVPGGLGLGSFLSSSLPSRSVPYSGNEESSGSNNFTKYGPSSNDAQGPSPDSHSTPRHFPNLGDKHLPPNPNYKDSGLKTGYGTSLPKFESELLDDFRSLSERGFRNSPSVQQRYIPGTDEKDRDDPPVHSTLNSGIAGGVNGSLNVAKLGEDVLSCMSTVPGNASLRPKMARLSNVGMAGDIEVSLVPACYPSEKFSKQEVIELGDQIQQLADRVDLDSPLCLRFRGGFAHRNGSLYIHCVDEKTRYWINSVASQVKVGNKSVKAVDPKDLVKHLSGRAFLPGAPNSKEDILKKFQVMNKNVRAREWTILEVTPTKNGAYVVFRFPEDVIPDLEKGGYELFYGWHSVTLKVFDENKGRGEEGSQGVDWNNPPKGTWGLGSALVNVVDSSPRETPNMVLVAPAVDGKTGLERSVLPGGPAREGRLSRWGLQQQPLQSRDARRRSPSPRHRSAGRRRTPSLRQEPSGVRRGSRSPQQSHRVQSRDARRRSPSPRHRSAGRQRTPSLRREPSGVQRESRSPQKSHRVQSRDARRRSRSPRHRSAGRRRTPSLRREPSGVQRESRSPQKSHRVQSRDARRRSRSPRHRSAGQQRTPSLRREPSGVRRESRSPQHDSFQRGGREERGILAEREERRRR